MENTLQPHWQPLALTTQPPAERGSSLVYDQERQQAVLLAEAATWLWDGAHWSLAQPQAAPPPRSTAHLIYDSTTARVLLFGGVGIDGTPLSDMWLWDGSVWTEQHPGQRPSPVGGASLACDSSRGQVILFGGIMGFDGSTGSNRVGTFSNATWLWDGITWTEQTISNAPPARAGGQMVYDEARQQALLFGGYGPKGYLNDMWFWNGTTWLQLSPSVLPPMQIRSSTAFHRQLQQVILLTESTTVDQSQHMHQTWLWDGVAWSQGAPDQGLPGSIEGFAYDGARNTIIARVVTGSKGLLASKNSGGVLPNLAMPTLASETWTW